MSSDELSEKDESIGSKAHIGIRRLEVKERMFVVGLLSEGLFIETNSILDAAQIGVLVADIGENSAELIAIARSVEIALDSAARLVGSAKKCTQSVLNIGVGRVGLFESSKDRKSLIVATHDAEQMRIAETYSVVGRIEFASSIDSIFEAVERRVVREERAGT